jgi:hypothetical protein
MTPRPAVTLSNENGSSRSRPSHTFSPPSTPPYGPPTAGRQAVLLGPPLPSDHEAGCPAGSFGKPAVLGCAHRVDLTHRHNDRSPEREE